MPEGITLTGVAGSGAIFSFSDGSQRFVSLGRQVAPGVVLQAVRLRDVILAAGPTNYRLGFGGGPVAIQPPATPLAAQSAGGAPQLVLPGAGRNALGGPMIGEAQQREMSRALVAGLEPRNNGGRVSGWLVKPGSNLPALQQAGLQPGDVLVAVNGEQVLDQEQVAGLPQQIANAHRVEFTFERNGQRMTRAIEVNPRR
jgi:general secretion pathway protein C